MNSNEVRQSFLDFFRERQHLILPSVPLVPQDDPTLLFINAGMNPFKPIFLNQRPAPAPRAASCQKCLRVSGKHNDLEEVGHDGRHHTFFEMLGNWSFGDYYKAEAIEFAWDYLTRVLGLNPEKMYATVYREDEESEKLWRKISGLPSTRIQRFAEKDNFWEMGETGPCGPCSEIHYDMGESLGAATVNAGNRIVEVWNLVFIQYDRDAQGTLSPLPARHVDTGMGLERLTAILSGKLSNFETDIFSEVFAAVSEYSGQHPDNPERLAAFQVIGDHIRALTFAIADGVIPSNEGRGYVIRRILRRAARYGRKLGLHEPFLHRLVTPLTDRMGDAYPELVERHQHIVRVIQSEETRFLETLDQGIALFDQIAAKVDSAGGKVLPGEDAFRLYDTFGFPVDLTRVMAEERGLTVDEAGFTAAMEKQRETARAAAGFSDLTTQYKVTIPTGIEETDFVGYTELTAESSIIMSSPGTFVAHSFIPSEIILARTPFYGESGGQVGDTGYLQVPSLGKTYTVINTKRSDRWTIHEIQEGMSDDESASLVDKIALALVDVERRAKIQRNHTATHLLHAALRHHLGDHVHQKGSLVAPERLRFDFTHYSGIEAPILRAIEDEVNAAVQADHPVRVHETTLEEAKSKGAMALFDEKYGDKVRMIEIAMNPSSKSSLLACEEGRGGVPVVSLELCGGTHVDRTGEIGPFRIVSEGGVAAGVRRIEAVTGTGALQLFREEQDILTQVSDALKVTSVEVPAKLEALLESLKSAESEVRRHATNALHQAFFKIWADRRQIRDIDILMARVPTGEMEALHELSDRFRELSKHGIMLLVGEKDGKYPTLVAVTEPLIAHGVQAGHVFRKLGEVLGAKGGGKPHLAQGSVAHPERLIEAEVVLEKWLAETVK